MVSDSRGRDLETRLNSKYRGTVKVCYLPGAGINRIICKAKELIDKDTYDILCISGGICDITTRNVCTKITHLPPATPEEITDKLSALLELGLGRLQGSMPPDRTIILPIYDIELNRYNGLAGVSDDQERMNFSITSVNRIITASNNHRNLSTPAVTSIVHHSKGHHKWSHRYKYLKDGCHLDETAKDYFVDQLVKTLSTLEN